MFSKRVILLFLVCAGMCFGQWVQIDSGLTNTNVLCLAVSTGNIFVGTRGGVFLSTNNGTSWNAVNSGLTRANVICFAVSDSNIFAGTNDGVGIFLSTNNGKSWAEVNSGFAGCAPGYIAPVNIYALAVGSGNIFAATSSGIYISTNNGAYWTGVNNGLPTNPYYVAALAASGSNIFAGGFGVFLFTNNGATWTAVDNGLPTYTVTCLAVSGENIFAGTGGVYLSTNNGTSWNAVNSGLTDTNVSSLAVSDENIFAVSSGGVFLSTNNGAKWTAVNSGLLDSAIVTSLTVSNSDIFAGTNGGGVWRRPLSEMIPTSNHEFQNKQPSVNNLRINITKTNVVVSMPASDGAITVELVNISGKKMYSATHQAYNGILSIPVSGLSTGTYLMSITGKNITQSSSFVVTK